MKKIYLLFAALTLVSAMTWAGVDNINRQEALSNDYDTLWGSWTSTNHNDGSSSSHTWTIYSVDGELSFDWSVSSESGCDWLWVYLDDELILKVSGEQSGTYTDAISGGTHTLVAYYSKDGSVSNGQDQATITNIVYLFNIEIISEAATDLIERTTTALDTLSYAKVNGRQQVEDLKNQLQTMLSEGFNEDNVMAGITLAWQLYEATMQMAALDDGYVALALAVDNMQQVAAANQYLNQPVAEQAQQQATWTLSQLDEGAFTASDVQEQQTVIASLTTRVSYLHLDIAVNTPGAMGDSILARVENFTDVQSLRLIGKLNNDDIYSLKNRLTSLIELDLEGLDWTSIPSEQFSGKTYLERIILPANLENIGNNAFYNCQHLRSPKFPSSLKSIGSNAFYRTYAFTDIVLPEAFNSLGQYAFQESRLTKVTFPSTLKSISYYAFYDCDYLSDVNFNEQTAINDYAFYSCNRLDNLTMPKTLQSIGNYAFYYSPSLKNLELNEGLTSIGTDAFYDSDALQRVILPSTLLTIHGAAFHNCDNLWEMTCGSVVPPIVNSYNVADKTTMTLYVPLLSVNVYKQTQRWDNFDIQGINIMPDNITIMRDYNLNWPDSLSLDYRPNVTLTNNGNTFGSLTVNGNSTFSAGNFRLKWDENLAYNNSYYDNNKGRYYYNRNRFTSLVNNATARADEVTVELWTKAGRWAFLTVPFDVKVGDIRANFDGTPFVIRKYDGQKRANGLTSETWVDMTADSTLHAGQGYIWKSASTESNRDYNGFYIDALQTTNKNNLFANKDLEIPLAYYESEFEHNRSWNLIGNPFPCFFDIRAMQTSAPITIWDNYSRNYEALSPMDDAYVLNPGQAFFVQRPVDEESITFLKEGRQTNTDIRDITYNNSARAKAPQAERSVFNIVLSNGEQQGDRTRLVINAAANTNYEQGRDASKFMSLEQQSAQLYTLGCDNVRYAINERPLENGTARLGMQLPAEGLYTLTLNTMVENEVFLVDQLMGTEVRLDGNAEGYTFHAEAGTLDGRFQLRLGNGQVTGIENIQTSNLKTQNSDLFDLQGRRISQPQQKGIYVKNGHKTVVK